MQSKHILMFVVVAVLFGAIISMASSGVLVAAQTNNSNTNTPGTDSDFVTEALMDDDNEAEQVDGDDCADVENTAFESCSFNNVIDNSYLPMSIYVGKTLMFEGDTSENGTSVKVRELWNVRNETVRIADVETLVVVIQEYEDGELAQEALEYYAQGIDGTVYIFGERVADYEDGVAVDNNEESWTVGDDTAVPGITMPANPATGIGFAFQSVNVPGLAHELSEVMSLNESITVERGSFDNVLALNEYDFEQGETSQAFYAPGVGLVKEADENEELELISIWLTEYNPSINPEDFVSGVDNPYYTLTPGANFTYASETDDGTEENIVVVTNETKEILGIEATVVWDRVWLNGTLIEETLDWFAQDKDGNVWYMGENSTEYEDGVAVSTAGSWEAGVDGAKPGIIMEANPQAGDTYRQEYSPGEAEDIAEVVSLGETVTVPFGTFTDCIQTREWSPLDPELNEYKFHCSEVGGLALEIVIDSGERVELVDAA